MLKPANTRWTFVLAIHSFPLVGKLVFNKTRVTVLTISRR